MVLPIPNLDDRRFDDLVKEGRERVARHLPELTHIAPGDPAQVMVDLFAYLTESMLYRMNLIPERQRRAVMNLLQIPIRTATPARGLVCIDANPTAVTLPALVRDGAQLKAGALGFTSAGEVQPTPLILAVSIKRALSDEQLAAMGLTAQQLRDQYGIRRGERPQAFEPRAFSLGKEVLKLEESLDKYFYLALLIPKKIAPRRDEVLASLAGITLNIAVAPADDEQGNEVSGVESRALHWELMSQDEDGNLLGLPLEILADSSRGGRRSGVVRLRLPANTQLFDAFTVADPMFAGLGAAPPELEAPHTPDQVAFWLRLSCTDEPNLSLGYLGVNGLDVLGQGLKSDTMIGVGTGQPDQTFKLPDTDIDPASLILQVEEEGAWVTWQRVDFLVGLGGDARVYYLEAGSGVVRFGDGLEGGKRVPSGRRVRVASYLFGGGSRTNVAAGQIKELSAGSSRLNVRHEWPTRGGVDAETVTQAERRIPQFLTHRNRAVAAQDFRVLAENNPVNPVAKASVVAGFLPGSSINAVRENVPGAVSLFVLPPRAPALRQTPKATKGLLKDVFEYLLPRTLIGTELYVLSPEYVPLAVGVKLQVLDPETEQETLQAVQTALVRYLWPLAPGGALGRGWEMGVAVRGNELEAQVARVSGVRAVNGLSLFSKRDTGGWRRHAENEALALMKYQLPELLGVSVGTGGGQPELPGGIDPLSGGNGNGGVPAPVIPEVC